MTNLIINELFAGIVFLQHTEELDDTGILERNEQQISDYKRGRTSASNLWRLVIRYKLESSMLSSLVASPVET